MKETITLNTYEQKRVMVLNRILAGQLSVVEAAPLLNRSHRQVQRMLAAYRKEGAGAVVHGNRGRKPKQSMSIEVQQQVIALAQTTYQGCNQQHLRDGARKNGRGSHSHAAVCIASCKPQDCWPSPSGASHSIGVGANGMRKKGCWCRLTAVCTPGWGSVVHGSASLQPSTTLPARSWRRSSVSRKTDRATFCWCFKWSSRMDVRWRSITIAIASLRTPASQPRRIACRSS